MNGASGDAPLYLALHIPKCAGTTLEQHLHAHLGDMGVWVTEKRSRHVPLELMGRKWARPKARAETIRAVSGHYLGRSVLRLFNGRRVETSVLLRDPAALMLSWYNHRMARYAEKGMAAYPFRLHLRALPPDPVAHFLLERWLELPWWRIAALPPAGKIALLAVAMDAFDHVDDIAGADRRIARISAGLGIPVTAARFNTKEINAGRSGRQAIPADDLDAADRALLTQRTRIDAWLWRRWALGERSLAAPADPAPFLASELARPMAEIRRRLARGG